MGKKITIIGSGATALGAAATFTALSHRVTLADEEKNRANLDDVWRQGGILLRGNGLRGQFKPEHVTTDIAEAVTSAEVIFVSTVAERHAQIAELIAPVVRSGQVIVIVPGNVGALIFDGIFKKAGVHADAPLMELQGNLFPIRITGPAEVNAGGGLRRKRAAAFPATDTDKAIDRMEGILELDAAKNIFETTLNAPNVINHLASTVLNAAEIDQAGEEFSLFRTGLTPSVFVGLEAAWKEWQAVMDRLGYWKMTSPVTHLRKVAEYCNHPELEVFRSLNGPDSLHHRYVTEDASCGVALLVSLADKLKVSVPFTRSLLNIVSALNQTDYYSKGRTLDAFGLSNLEIEEINRYLYSGIR